VTSSRYCDGDGIEEEEEGEEGKEKELDILVNVTISLSQKAASWSRAPLMFQLGTTRRRMISITTLVTIEKEAV
jgi:hypothetical protein